MTRTASLSLLTLGLLLGLSACKAGPDYKGPPPTAAGAQARGAFLRGDGDTLNAAPSARWWEALGDPVLTGLVDDALAHSPNIDAAQAKITQARAGLAGNRAALLPSLGTSFVAPYINLPAGTLGLAEDSGERIGSTSYSVAFDASWELDLRGANRRKVESAAAKADAAEAGLADAQVSLSAEVARAYVSLRLRQAMAAAQEQQAGIDRSLVSLAEQRLTAGTAPAQPLDQARSQLAQSESDLAKSRAETLVLIDQIAVLTGREPGALDTLLSTPASIPQPPAQVAVGDPASLMRNRPDIRTAERQLAAANADIGAKIAARFPKVSFIGLLGLGGTSIGDIVDPSSVLGAVLPQISWSLFDGGRSAADVRSAKGAHAEADAKYRTAVLTALQDAENSLTRFGAQRIAYARALDARDRAAHSAGLQAQRAAAGTAGRSDALSARRQQLQAELTAASARADLSTAFVAVEKALGLGWTPSFAK
ncbi:MAG TPA: efflux transporter outer membrane subunit [Sphingobium sp.]|uniref:efflux transporter outer membrane subunit n=1 Tax=Sphingobium sp. TaxID=1912891 RepID=UPI002ED66FD9